MSHHDLPHRHCTRRAHPGARRLITLAALAALAGHGAQAATYTWVGGAPPTPTSWINPLNWQGALRPFSADDAVLAFPNSFVAASNDVQADFHLNRLHALDNGGTGTLLGQSLRLAGSGAEVFVGSAGSLVLNNALLGNTAWSKTGAGTLALGGDNTGFGGAITVASGRLLAAGINALGQGGGVTLAAGSTLRTVGVQTVAGLAGSGSWEATGSNTVLLASGQRSFSGSLSGGGNLLKSGAGTQTLATTGTLGAVTVTAGALEFTGAANQVQSGNLVVGNGGTARARAGTTWNVGGVFTLGRGTMAVDGGAQLTVSSQMTLGDLSGSLLQVAGGGRLETLLGTVGAGVLQSAVVDVSDAHSLWHNTGTTVVGAQGNGTVTVRNGGAVESGGLILGQERGSLGRAQLSGQGSHWSTVGAITVGQAGVGQLMLDSGASFSSASAALGALPLSSGDVQVNGGATWNAGSSLAVGLFGSGTLALADGGNVSTGSMTVGQLGTGSVSLGSQVSGSTSQLVSTGVLTVGQGNTGSIDIRSGGSLRSGDTTLGVNEGINGSVSLLGDTATASWTSGALDVGAAGYGTLDINGRASVTSSSARIGVADSSTSVGLVRVQAGALWTVVGELRVGDQGEGTLAITQGGRVQAGSVRVGTTGTYSNGAITVNGVNGGLDATLAVARTLTVGDTRTQNTRVDNPQVMTIGAGGTVDVGGAMTIRNTGIVRLNGGTLMVGTLSTLGDGRLDWTSGQLRYTGAGGTGLGDGGFLGAVLSLQGNKSLVVDHHFNIGTGTVALGGAATLRAGSMELGGGQIVGSTLDLTPTPLLTGYGSVTSRVVGSSADGLIRASGGSLVLGNLNLADGFAFAGVIDVEQGRRLVLHAADSAPLGRRTVLGEGSQLQSLNGLVLGSQGTLSAAGNGLVLGAFVNQGQVLGPQPGDARLVFNDAVSGGGSFSGAVRFNQTYSPGNSAAAVQLGDVEFAPSAHLALDLLGAAPGSGHDQLNVAGSALLDGTLALTFGAGFSPQQGSSFVLMTWGQGSGRFADYSVSGLAQGLGTQLVYGEHALQLNVTAVPEPASWALMLVGVAGLRVWRRR
jgi:MYXO-CTERM domain-containing protein